MKRKKYRKPEKKKNSSLKFILKSKIPRILLLFFLIFLSAFIIIRTYRWGKHRYENYVKFFNEFNPIFAPGDNLEEHVNLDLNNSFNLLFVGLDSKKSGHIKADVVILIHYDAVDQIFQVINLPCKMYYYVPLLKDYSQLDNVYAIGQLETPEQGMNMLYSTLEDNLALSINGYLAMDAQQMITVFGELDNIVIQNEQKFCDPDLVRLGLRSDFAEGRLRLNSEDALGYIMADEGGFFEQSNRYYSVLNSLKLMLNRSLVYKLLEKMNVFDLMFSNIRGESIKKAMNFVIENKDNVEFYSLGSVIDYKTINESVIPVFSVSKFDQRISEIFTNRDIKLEQARIEIYNGTPFNGLAGKYSRYVANFGGDVTRVSSKMDEYNNTLIFVENPDRYQNTLRNLESIFKNLQIIEGSPDFSVTGDIVIIIGNDAEQ